MAKLSTDQFAEQIKAKYPQYQSVDNSTLTQKMLEKYPAYSDRVEIAPATPTFTQGHLENAPGGTYGGAIKDSFANAISQANAGADQARSSGPLGKIEGLFKFGSGLVNAATSPLAPLVNSTVGKAIGGVVNKTADTISNIPAVQRFSNTPLGLATGQVAGRVAEDATNVGTVLGAVAGGPKVGSVTKDIAENAYQTLPTLSRESLQTAAAKGKIPMVEGVGPQTITSAERLAPKAPLIGVGAARQAAPLDVYNAFAKQEARHIADIKNDPALSVVGQRIGDAFEDVAKQRREAGKIMSAEVEKLGSTRVPLDSSIGDFQNELLDNGASYDTINREVVAGPSSKFATADKSILNKYANELQSLGKSPTLKQLDAFVSRMPNEIEGLKSERGITFVTNAERIVKKNLSSLRDALADPQFKQGLSIEGKTPEQLKTSAKKPELVDYYLARKKYSDLSKFLEEGSGFLGKKTQSGDYAKDASIAKSSVQSVLNNGKKDWLIKLEGLTGYPALDEAVLALQAMKDAGDFKGASLLELLSDGGSKVPTTAHGVTERIIGAMGKLGAKATIGSKADQTRALLKAIGQKKE